MSKFGSILCSAVIGLSTSDSFAQTPYPVANSVPVSQIDRTQMETELVNLKKHVADLKATDGDLRLVADVDVFAKAAEWILRA